uniref:Saposin B-type domain-containing protein n=1 Tax=Plectus sambesii TaxID=2011161 RepID=A0A914WK74_9BILA
MKYTAVIFVALIACGMALPSKRKGPAGKAELGGILCDTCKQLVGEAESAGAGLGAPWLEDQIQKLCAELGIFKQFCCDELDGTVEALAQLIQQDLPPPLCCYKVDLCDAPPSY